MAAIVKQLSEPSQKRDKLTSRNCGGMCVAQRYAEQLLRLSPEIVVKRLRDKMSTARIAELYLPELRSKEMAASAVRKAVRYALKIQPLEAWIDEVAAFPAFTPSSGRKWDDAEEQLLRRLYAVKGFEPMLIALEFNSEHYGGQWGRTSGAIRAHIYKLGLHLRDE